MSGQLSLIMKWETSGNTLPGVKPFVYKKATCYKINAKIVYYFSLRKQSGKTDESITRIACCNMQSYEPVEEHGLKLLDS